MAISVRKFNTPFSIKLNSFAEDETHGFYSNYLRFMIFLGDMNNEIEEINKKTRDELQKEDPEVAASMASQPDVDAQLNFFSGMLIRGLVISMYSYLDNQAKALHDMLLSGEVWNETGIPNNENLGESDLIKNAKRINNWVLHNDFKKARINPSLLELINWTKVRNDLVHNNGEVNDLDNVFLDRNGIKVTNHNISVSKEGALRLNELIYKFLSEIVEEINAKHGLVTRTPSK